MVQTHKRPSLGFVYYPEHICSALMESALETGTKAIIDLSFIDPGEVLEALLRAGRGLEAVELKLPADILGDTKTRSFLDQAGITTVWTELHEWMETGRALEAIGELPEGVEVIPVTGSLRLIGDIMKNHPHIKRLGLKGNEASGFTGADSLFTIYSTARAMAGESGPSLAVWGGIGMARAAAAFLAANAGRIVFESLHWLSDLFSAPGTFSAKIEGLRVEHTEVLGVNLDVPCRIYNKGNSRAARALKDLAGGLCGAEAGGRKRLEFCREIQRRLAPPLLSTFGRDELIPLGVEASFASSFTKRYGVSTKAAISGFIEEIERHLRGATEVQGSFVNSPTAEKLGARYPFIQGAMTWITDNARFARRIAEAGGLPTLALGMMDAAGLEKALADLPSVMENFPYAVNVIALDENPFRETQMSWIKRNKPPFAVIAAGAPSHAAELIAAGIETFYIVSGPELLRPALEGGVSGLILEGNEAGGHVGQYTTLMWAQLMLLMKQREPELFEKKTIVLAGGICNRETAFMAAMLGADAIQMGTAYLAVSDIVQTESLTPVYQKLVLEAAPGRTVITGESIGLRVRSLRTPVVESVCTLERNLLSQRDSEASIRRRIEGVCAGSLMIAARGKDPGTGRPVEDRECVERGQFMCGAAAGAISTIKSVRDLHEELARGGLGAGVPFTGPLVEPRERPSCPRVRLAPGASNSGGRERIAITGMSCVNSLGKDPESVWAASRDMRSGVTRIPANRWNHERFFDPRPGTPEKTYCGLGAFQDLEVSRADIETPPQDFRSMANCTKATLWLASRAVKQSGILESNIPRERIAVIVSQNSGEAASTLADGIIRASAGKIVESVNRVVNLSTEQQAKIEEAIKAGRIAIDDTTLLGRLNCTAAGFICNKYGLSGPSFSVSAACATSLVALYSAFNMIRNGVIDAAVIGGAEELLTPMHFLEFSALGALAGFSGKNFEAFEASRPFDRARDGMVLGEGGAMIVLERESVALARGAKILANITSMGGCNSRFGMVESSKETQETAIRASLADLQYGPESIDLVECHATGTIQGDIEEVLALKSIFGSAGTTALTSFKSQIGHTLGASGLCSLIRGVTAMNEGIFPPTLNFEKADPRMELDGSGLRVCPRPEHWPLNSGGARRMQVNAFGFGGSNFVVQLQEPDNGAPVLVRLEEKSEARRSREESKMLRSATRRGVAGDTEGVPPNMAFVFPGQGSHYAGMGHELYRTFPLIREWLDRAAELADFDLLKLMFHGDEGQIRETGRQQPALFSIEYAIARMLMSLGLRPAAMAGHSLGELTALCLAGVYSFEDGFRIVSKRAACMEKACSMSIDPGKMMAVDAPMELIREWLAEKQNCYIANVNSPSQTVIGGNAQELTSIGEQIRTMGYRGTFLPVSMAFHSPVMHCIHDEMDDFTRNVEFHAPRIPVVSNTTGRPFPDDPAQIRRILMAHLESPVLWMEDVRVLWNDFGIRLFVEAGPKAVVSDLIADTIEEAHCAPTCFQGAEERTLKAALAKIHAVGNFPAATTLTDIEIAAAPDAAAENGPSKAAPEELKNLQTLVQRQLNSFIIESFGKFIKPSILAAIRAEYDPRFSELELEKTLQGMFPAPGQQLETQAALCAPPTSVPAPGTAMAGTDPVTEAVIGVIMEATGYDSDEIEPEMDLRRDLAIRSSRLPVLINSLESRFAIRIDFQDFRDVRTISDVSKKISEIMVRKESGQTTHAGASTSQGAGGRSPARKPPVKRLVFRDCPLEEAPFRPVEVTPTDSVVVLSPVGRSEFGGQIRDLLVRDYGCDVHPAGFLENAASPAGRAFDLMKPGGGGPAAEALGEIESLAGLVIVLDKAAAALVESVDGATGVLEEFFPVLKSFLASSARRFLVLVDVSEGPGTVLSVLREGLLGAFLAATHEHPGVLFRSVRADGAARAAQVIRAALNTETKPVEITIESQGRQGAKTRIAKSQPCVFSETPRLTPGRDDVILFTGGCSGLMPYLAQEFIPFGCKAAFVGRTAVGPQELETPKTRDILKVLDKLRAAGIDAEYFAADVADPAAMALAARAIEEKLGKITGIVHGAGILRDGFLENMSSQDFSAVLRPKLKGAWTLFELGLESVRFFVCLSSAACVLGNPGQVNYCCANRAMSALVSHLMKSHEGIVFKSIMLPPLEGAGMAENPALKSLMESMGIAYVHVEEISNLILRELQFSDREDEWVMFMRSFPKVEKVLLDIETESPGGAQWGAMSYPSEFFPLIDSLTEQRTESADLVAERIVNRERDLWITDHKPFKFLKNPLVSAIMAIEMFMETARILHPGLAIAGLRDARFINAIECPEGKDCVIRLHGKTRSRKSGLVECAISLSSSSNSTIGTNADRSDIDCRAIARMGAPGSDPLTGFLEVRKDELDSRPMGHGETLSWYEDRSDLRGRYRVIDSLEGSGPGTVRGRTIYRTSADFKHPSRAGYQYSPYLLEALMQMTCFYIVMRDDTERRSLIPLGLEGMSFERGCADGEEFTLEGRIREKDDTGITWDARATDLDRKAVMVLKGLRMGWFAG